MIDFLSYNIQAGIGTYRPLDYILKAHRQVLPVRPKIRNLERIADYIRHHDVVCLQEVDFGGFRTGFLNQARYLKARARFPFMVSQLNRRVGRLSMHGNLILSRLPIRRHLTFALPGSLSGRGLLVAEIGTRNPVWVANTHFSLGPDDQTHQFKFVDNVLGDFPRVILAGDFNCTPDSTELMEFDEGSDLDMVTEIHHHAFPSWKPSRAIDHIFVSKSLGAQTCEIGSVRYSDHLPLHLKIDV